MLAGFARRRVILNTQFMQHGRSSATVCCDSSSYTDKMEKTGRPLSPHVTIYKFPIPAISSITHRVSEVGVSAIFFGVGAMSLCEMDVAHTMQIIGETAVVSSVVKAGFVGSMSYNIYAGIRHWIWDKKPEYVTTEIADKSSYAIFGATALTTLISLFI